MHKQDSDTVCHWRTTKCVPTNRSLQTQATQYWVVYWPCSKYFDLLQGKTKAGVLQFDLLTNRDGAKYYIKPRPSPKDMSWKDSIVSATLQVIIVGNIRKHLENISSWPGFWEETSSCEQPSHEERDEDQAENCWEAGQVQRDWEAPVQDDHKLVLLWQYSCFLILFYEIYFWNFKSYLA